MNVPIGVAVVVAVLLAVWVKLAEVLGMPWFVGLIGWACYVAAGRKMKGLGQVIAAGVAGMAWVAVLDMGALLSGHEELELVAVGVAALAVLLQSRVSLLSFVPAGLCGIAVLGAGGPMGLMDLAGNTKLALSFVFGAVLAFLAEWVGGKVSKRPAGA